MTTDPYNVALYEAFETLLDDSVPQTEMEDLTVLANDLVDMYYAEQWEDSAECYAEWILRIGGARNIPAYLASLKAGKERDNEREYRMGPFLRDYKGEI